MNEIIEQLRAAALHSSSYLDLPTEDELLSVEEELLLAIPREFRDFLLHASDLICGCLEPVTVADAGAHTHLPEVTANAWAKGLPRDLMVVCDTGNGYYCINPLGEIYFWQSANFTDESWQDIWQWAEDVWLRS